MALPLGAERKPYWCVSTGFGRGREIGQRGYLATRLLGQEGILAANLGGGYRTYRLFRPGAAAVGPPARQPCGASR